MFGEFLAVTGLDAHRTKLHSTNPFERPTAIP